MTNAQMCFQLADACIRQAEQCLSASSLSHAELEKVVFLGDQHYRKVTEQVSKFQNRWSNVMSRCGSLPW